MIGLVTDSNAMLPDALATRLRATVVPLSFTVDGTECREDAALDLAAFYRDLRAGASVRTAAPSPGSLAAAYSALAEAGATEILSVHVGSAYSGTVNAALVAARHAPIPVHVVDSTTASFALGCCVWAAAEQLGSGGTIGAAAAAAQAVPVATTSVFTVGEPERARIGGRLDVAAPTAGVPVIALAADGSASLGEADHPLIAVDQMVGYLERRVEGPVRVGVGDADNHEAANLLADALGSLADVTELVRYRVGPTVAAHTGAGTFGAVVWALEH